MTVELGHFSLILALFVAIVQATVPLLGAQQGNVAWMALARPAAVIQFVLVTVAFAMLMRAYIVSDFSVHTVALHSHTAKPLLYRITGLWGNHEGSMVLWVMILSLFGTALAIAADKIPIYLRVRTLSIQAMITASFLLFILFVSNPFWRLDPPVSEGRGFNPLLQDPGLAFHPPLLYLGYVGFSIAFSFAIAALIEGWVDSAWARWVRPWTLAAWIFLTLGIALGSWWAYYELGWGGWWFWDPVENAALIPWLTGTALIHSLRVVEKRDALKKWTILLAIMTFSLSLLGTFLVRSGILTSVHTFATDPTRGTFILVLLTITVGGSLVLFTFRASFLQSGSLFKLFSREGSLLVNNALLLVIMATVLLGTLYPLLAEVVGIGRLSVGAPFFHRTVVPLAAPLLLITAIGPLLAWKQGRIGKGTRSVLVRKLWPAAILTILTIITMLFMEENLVTACGIGIAIWLGVATLLESAERVLLFRIPIRASLRRAVHLPRAAYGMTLSHLGLAVLAAGLVGATAWETGKNLVLQSKESTELSHYTFTLDSLQSVTGPNYHATRGKIIVRRHNHTPVTILYPEQRYYTDPPQITTEAAIYSNGMSDVYVTISEEEHSNKEEVIVRLYYKPLVPWLWYGTGLMALGGVLSLSDRRHRTRVRSRRLFWESENHAPCL